MKLSIEDRFDNLYAVGDFIMFYEKRKKHYAVISEVITWMIHDPQAHYGEITGYYKVFCQDTLTYKELDERKIKGKLND